MRIGTPDVSWAGAVIYRTLVIMIMMGMLYFEPVYVGGVKWSYLWKAAASAVLLLWLLATAARTKKVILPRAGVKGVLYAGCAYALWALVPAITSEKPAMEVFAAVQRLFPLLVTYALVCTRPNAIRVNQWLAAGAVATAISSIPFLVDKVASLGRAFDAAGVLASGGFGFIGVFQNPHAASLTFALTATYGLSAAVQAQSSLRRTGYAALTVLLAFFCFSTYVRAGLLMLAVGAAIFAVRSGSLRKKARAVLVLGATATALAAFTPEGMQNRLLGITQQNRTVTVERFTSGRVGLIRSAFQLYVAAPPSAWVVGLGHARFLDEMEEHAGRRYEAHNAYVGELARHGVVGLGLLLTFLISVWHAVRRVGDEPLRTVGMAMLAGVVVFGLIQGLDYPIQIAYVLLVPLASGGRAVPAGAIMSDLDGLPRHGDLDDIPAIGGGRRSPL